MTKVEIDQIFLAKHSLLTQRFYLAKGAGQITPVLQALFDKAHGYLTLTHERAIRLLGAEAEARGEGDYLVDEKRDDETGAILTPGTKLRSQELAEALTGPFQLTPAQRQIVKTRWGVTFE